MRIFGRDVSKKQLSYTLVTASVAGLLAAGAGFVKNHFFSSDAVAATLVTPMHAQNGVAPPAAKPKYVPLNNHDASTNTPANASAQKIRFGAAKSGVTKRPAARPTYDDKISYQNRVLAAQLLHGNTGSKFTGNAQIDHALEAFFHGGLEGASRSNLWAKGEAFFHRFVRGDEATGDLAQNKGVCQPNILNHFDGYGRPDDQTATAIAGRMGGNVGAGIMFANGALPDAINLGVKGFSYGADMAANYPYGGLYDGVHQTGRSLKNTAVSGYFGFKDIKAAANATAPYGRAISSAYSAADLVSLLPEKERIIHCLGLKELRAEMHVQIKEYQARNQPWPPHLVIVMKLIGTQKESAFAIAQATQSFVPKTPDEARSLVSMQLLMGLKPTLPAGSALPNLSQEDYGKIAEYKRPGVIRADIQARAAATLGRQ